MERVAIARNQIVVNLKNMKTTNSLLLTLFAITLLFSSCTKKEEAQVTFIELGSVRCIPCQKMQKVIKKVEEKYPTQVKTVFYDVWTDEGEEASKNFEFDEIPTQVFLDENGKEYYRHVGYFEFEELEKILNQKIK